MLAVMQITLYKATRKNDLLLKKISRVVYYDI